LFTLFKKAYQNRCFFEKKQHKKLTSKQNVRFALSKFFAKLSFKKAGFCILFTKSMAI